MKAMKISILAFAMLFALSVPAAAADFDWMKSFNVQASADPSGFRAKLCSRFQIGDAQVTAVMRDIKDPASVYMAFRLGEMSHRPVEDVVNVYKKNKRKGWGVMARSLGIKPGSAEFHALKRGHDLDGMDRGKGKGKDKSKGKGKGKGKGKWQDDD